MADMRKKESKDLLQRAKDRYLTMYEADQENRRAAMDDMKFINVPGEQWDENMKQERGKRPCYEFNKLRVTCKRVINDMRANRAQPKIRAVEDGDKEQADIREGLVRNIWNMSDADTVIDNAADYQVGAGMGAWRVDTDYSDDGAFEQDIIIREIPNPFALYCDPSAKDHLKRDADDWIYTEKITHKAFEAKYGKKEAKDHFEDSIEFDDDDIWEDEENVRVAEYWYKEPVKKELWLVPNEQTGEQMVVDSESDEAAGIPPEMIARRREVMTNQIYWCVVSGSRVLEGPTEWASNEFPFVVIYGEQMVIDGRPLWWGLPRFSKDAQRAYNVARTAIAETIAQAPQAKWWATVDQAKGHTEKWAVAHKENFPFLLYNADQKVPGPPLRMGGADVPIALIQESQLASEEIKSTSGIFDPSLGAQSNETSGRAIYARQQQGEIATFNFQDNMAKGIKRTCEIVLSLIPNIYDTERELRILGSDGAEDYVKVNQLVQVPGTDQVVRVNDLAAGKYDVAVTVGPSFSTKRQEASEIYGQLGQQWPDLMAVAGDLVMKSMDLPYAEDIADRLKVMLPPQIQQQMQEGQEMPPEVQQAMAQVEQMSQQVQQHGQLVQAASAELEGQKAELEKTVAQMKTEQANIKAARAEFDAHVAEVQLGFSEKDSTLREKALDIERKAIEMKEQALQPVAEEVRQYLMAEDAIAKTDEIDDILASFMEATDMAVTAAQQQANRKIVSGSTRRDGGRLIADIEYDDGTTRSVAAIRKDGQLQIEPEQDFRGDAQP
jgi:hypothetical protein